MARSHEKQQEYMANFEQALVAMGQSGDAYTEAYAHKRADAVVVNGSIGRELASAQAVGAGPAPPSKALVRAPAAQGASWTAVKHGQEVVCSGTASRIVDVSDRNVLCVAVRGETAILGLADHGLVEMNVRSGVKTRTLYTKRFGHTDWVTSVAYCADGRVLSGGADSKLCLWNASGVSCADLSGHLGSISRVEVDASGLALSSAYDRTVRIWDLKSKREAACCTGHNAPVMTFAVDAGIIVSGDRSGVVKAFDLRTASNVHSYRPVNVAISTMAKMDDGIAVGTLDGNVLFLQGGKQVSKLRAHKNGACSDLAMTSSGLLVSTGADGAVRCWDRRNLGEPVSEFEGTTEDFLYALHVVGDVAFTGDGRGVVKCFDVKTGERGPAPGGAKYAIPAAQNAIRCIAHTDTSLVCAGDDGNALMYDFA
jgi:WD40 repeat protein